MELPQQRVITPYEVAMYRDLYQREGIVSVPALLLPPFADKFLDFYLHRMPKDAWALAVNPAPISLIAENDENGELIRKEWKRIGKEVNNHGLSYRFHRTYGKCCTDRSCEECLFRQYLSSPEMLSLLREISGEPLTHTHAVFGSRYDAGSFLTLHTDAGNGQLAFVYNLTKEWNPIWGGCLHLLESDLRTIRKVITPSFNTLTCFRVPPGGVPHYVSPVFSTVMKERIAVSGWFKCAT